MTEVDLVRRLHEHRMWSSHKLLAAASQLSSEVLWKSFAIGQGSIWKSLLHLYAAEYVWLGALLGDESPLTPGDLPTKIPGNQEGDNPIPTFARLTDDWRALDARWQTYLDELKADSLDDTVAKMVTAGPSTGKKMATRRGDVLLHVCTHAVYTSAQVVNMLRQAGVEKLPDLNLISLARQQMVAT
ncbi:MAG TPA: DinB family protein [Planctomycetaceae bacterium]